MPLITAREVAGLDVLPLRMAVLRPDQPVVEPDWHLVKDVHHFAAYDGDQVVGCASVFPSAYDDLPDAWQLRGMAVAASRQGQGIGAIVLAEAVEMVRASGASMLWANARVTALPFYERLGFQVVGEVFEYGPASLPHKKIEMWFDGRSGAVE